MSILIKGMEMPTSPVLFCIHPDGKVFADLEGGWREYKAVHVPPHGRLINADALYKDLLEDVGYGEAERFNDYWLGEQPTIIPAEEAAQKDGGPDDAPTGPYDLLYEEGGADA